MAIKIKPLPLAGKTNTVIWKFASLLTGVVLFIGGLGHGASYVLALGGVGSVVLLAFVAYKKTKIIIPKGFLIYGLFIFLFALSLFWSLNWPSSLGHLVLYVSGGVFWVAFFNLKGKSKNAIENIVVILGILFGTFALAYKYLNFAPFGRAPFSLVYPAIANHHHIGDIWAIVTVIVIHKVFVRKKYLYFLLFIPGVFFLILSLSKSAYLALATGAYFIFYYKGWIQKYNKILAILLFIIVALFLFAGAQKTTLFSRPYFYQALAGLIKHPLGVGYGNFESVSTECFGCFDDKLLSFSSVTHNIILEVLVGMGILGLSFVYWLYLVSRDLLESLKENNLAVSASFFALLTNFFFDFTYFIPTMLWIFFIFLGLAQEKHEQTKGEIIIIYAMSAFLIVASFLLSFVLLKFDVLR